MSQMEGSILTDSRQRSRSRWLFAAGCGLTAVLVAVVGVYCAQHSKSDTAQTVGDFGVLLAAATAALSCAWAARRATAERNAWRLLSVSGTVYAVAMAVFATYGLTRDHVYPYPSLADAGFIGYAIPAAAALFSFPAPARRLTSRLRTVLDALLIAMGILFVSWVTVLGTVVHAGGADQLTYVTSLGYPAVDVFMLSLVLTLGMRRPAGQRMPWLLLGGGLVVLAVTDSTYVTLLNDGQGALTGTLLAAGWMTAWFLVALAPWVPRSRTAAEVSSGSALAIDLIPYIPVFFAFVVSSEVIPGEDRFLTVSGTALFAVLAARQVMIVYENVHLTRDLEAKVALRTRELAGLGAIVNSSQDAIMSTTVEGDVLSWNPGAELLYGWRSDEMLGRNFSAVVSEARRDEEAAIVQRVREGEQIKSEFDRVHKDGSLVPVAATMSPILDDAGVVTGIASIEQDVTGPRARAAALAEAREKALETSRMKSEFLATMSHEIRTPMNGVIGLTGLLLTTPLNATQRQYANGVRDAGEALLTVINDILDFSKLEAGKVQLEVADFDVRRLVEDVAALLAPSAHAKQLELVAYCVPELPQFLRGDAGRVRQILLNLASNAVKFTAEGEVTIKVRSVDSGNGHALVRFEVRDTGIGVTAHDRDRLFESFSQADASTTRRYGGTGLGLAISTSLTKAMGGDIGVDSEVGSGSTFWFAIPLEVAAKVEEAPPAADIGLLTGLRTVIVDDNATNRLVLETQLTAWGLSADVVADAQTALVRIRAAALEGRPYGLAVLDMCMPGMDGLELAQHIRGDRTLDNDLKLMILTSSMAVEGGDLKAAGVDEWLTKPVRSSDLYDRIIHLMTPPAPPIQLTPSTTPVRRSSSTSRGHVLVVEDNTLNQLVAEGILGSLGYDVDIVDNGLEALAAVEAKTYAAVLMDCHMPVMDGYAATEEIRRRQAGGRRTPIIAMTAGAMVEDRERCMDVGMDDYVSKPVTAEAVDTALVRWIAEADSGAAAAGIAPSEASAPGTPSENPIDADRQAVLRALGPDDGWGILPAAVRAFLADNQVTMSAMRAAEGSGNSDALSDAAHQLRGAAANIGASSVAALCSELESRMRDHEPESCHDLIDQLGTELERTNGLLQDALPASA